MIHPFGRSKCLTLPTEVLYTWAMSETFYRVHNPDAPCFCAEHAYSALWGAEFKEDGSANKCRMCDATGIDYQRIECRSCGGAGGPDYDGSCESCDGFGYVETDQCATCDGTGWEPAIPGYSCSGSANELVEYFKEHTGGDPMRGSGYDRQVVVFEGHAVGTGFDGEPLAIPTGNVEWITWAELVERTKAAAN